MASEQITNIASELTDMSLENNEGTVPLAKIFSFDMNYRGDELQQKVCRVLGLDSVKGWSIVDTLDNLALIHYRDDSDLYQYGHLRGVLVDTEKEVIVSDSFGYTPSATYHMLPAPSCQPGEAGTINIIDENQVVHKFDSDKMSIKYSFEGVVIRCLWYNEKFYRITHKKIDSSRSRWGCAKTFVQMYDEAGAPTAEELFDTSKPYSSTVYTFIIVDKPLLVATKQVVNKPYAVFVESKEFDLKRPEDQVAAGKRVSGSSDIGAIVDKSFVHIPSELTAEEANNFLRRGYYDDQSYADMRQYPGESLIMYQEINGKTQAVKINSISYDWRVKMRGNNPNVVNQFYHLLKMTYADLDRNKFQELVSQLIPFPLYNKQELKLNFEKSPYPKLQVFPETVSPTNYLKRDDRIQLLWINYWFSLPHTNQLDALEILDNFKSDRELLVRWISNICHTTPNLDSTDHVPRVKSLIKACRNLATTEVKAGLNRTKTGQHIPFGTVVNSKIRNLINKEDGKSLYALIRTMKTPPPTVA